MKKSIFFAAALATTGCALAPLPAEAFGLGGLIQTVIGVPTQPQVRRVEPVQPRVAPAKPAALEVGEGGSLEILQGDMNITTHNTTINGQTQTEQVVEMGLTPDYSEVDASDVKQQLESLQWPSGAKVTGRFSANSMGKYMLSVTLEGSSESTFKSIKSSLEQQGYRVKPILTRAFPNDSGFQLAMTGPGPGDLVAQAIQTGENSMHISVDFN